MLGLTELRACHGPFCCQSSDPLQVDTMCPDQGFLTVNSLTSYKGKELVLQTFRVSSLRQRSHHLWGTPHFLFLVPPLLTLLLFVVVKSWVFLASCNHGWDGPSLILSSFSKKSGMLKLFIAWKGDMHLLFKSATVSVCSEQNNSSLQAMVIRDKTCLISHHILEGLLTIY